MSDGSGKTVLITGGAGFIGMALAERLLSLGFRVHVLDTYEASTQGITFFRASVLDQNAIGQAMEGCDYVVHLAAVLGVNNASRNPVECLDVNILGTRNVLEVAVKFRLKRIVFSSSSEVYGEPHEVPIKESATLAPKSEYGVSKVVSEEYCRAYQRRYDLPYTIIRFFNVYGERQRGDFVISAFINAVLADEPLFLNGDGSQVRSFCHVDDIAAGMAQLLLSPKAENLTVNLGNPDNPITMRELAERVVHIAGASPSLIQTRQWEKSDRTAERDILNRFPDTSKARDTIDFSPKIGLDEGLMRIIAYKRSLAKKK